MLKTLAARALGLGLGVLYPTLTHAQPTEVIVKQGDKIEWHQVSGPQHRVRFGGTVGTVTLTPVDQIRQRLGDFDPPLPDNGQPLPVSGKPLLVATVRADAPVDATFIFTCGEHPSAMISIPFKIRAAEGSPQTHRIDGVAGFHWKLQPGNVHIDTTP
jgi:hypothetical protein